MAGWESRAGRGEEGEGGREVDGAGAGGEFRGVFVGVVDEGNGVGEG